MSFKSQISNLNLQPSNPESQISDSGSGRKKTRGSGLRARAGRGFTFMELLIVMVIIAIMAAVAIPRFLTHLRRAKEVVLQQNLWAMRRAIDFYWQDKEKPPATLQDLVSAGYLRDIPKDPMCADCQWSEIAAPVEDGSSGGIQDVKSTAEGVDANGKAFTEY